MVNLAICLMRSIVHETDYIEYIGRHENILDHIRI